METRISGHRLVTVAALLCALASCGLEADPTDGAGRPEDAAVTMSIDLRTKTLASTPGYEQGSGAENLLDIAGGDYRIYFFTDSEPDGDDRFVARFVPSTVTASRNASGGSYSIVGTVPESMAGRTGFKVVVVANWGSYPDGGLVSVDEDPGRATSISALCSDEMSRYAMPGDFRLGPGNLIPMYGVQEYEGVELSPGTMVRLRDPVSLLRAMAKVEVTVRTAGIRIAGVRLCRYNGVGYCAPQKVYDGSYAASSASGAWTIDGLHLVGGANAGQGAGADAARGVDMLDVSAAGDSGNEDGATAAAGTWIAYVPEYDNSGDDFSYVEITPENGGARRVYFASYSDGRTTAYDEGGDRSGRIDIQRNNLYRFTVELTDNLFSVEVGLWDGIHDNDFVFDGN